MNNGMFLDQNMMNQMNMGMPNNNIPQQGMNMNNTGQGNMMNMGQGNMMNMGQGNMMNMGQGNMMNMGQQYMMMNQMNQGNTFMLGNTGMMNPMMMGNTGMMNPMMMGNTGMMNPMMMGNTGMMNPMLIQKMMDILNNKNENNNQNMNGNNIQNMNNTDNYVNQIPDLSEQIAKQEKEKKMKLIKQIINKEGNIGPVKHCQELEIISDMAIMGTITKDYITIDTNNNPNKYLDTQTALNSPEEYYRVLGYLSDYLTKQGVLTAIEKKDQNQLSSEKLKEIDTFLQFLINGLTNLKKHELRFDFSWEKNQLILSDIKEQENFMDELRYSLSQGLKIPPNHMVITYPRSGSVIVTVIFKTEDYNNLSLNTLKNVFSQYAPDLNHLVNIESNLLLDGVLLNPELLDSKGDNKNQGWGVNEMRGGRPYYPPIGWIGYGLKVLGKYDKGNNVWLNYNGAVGEWCVAYHGASQKINHNYSKMRDDDDMNHPGQKIGEGVYCCPKPNVLDNEGGVIQVGNKKFKIGFMLRVRPDKIRIAKSNPDYWVLNGDSSEIRPYRILIKQLN